MEKKMMAMEKAWGVSRLQLCVRGRHHGAVSQMCIRVGGDPLPVCWSGPDAETWCIGRSSGAM